MNPKKACALCLNVPKRNAITKIRSLPKTFTIILEEMSGVKFTNAESLDMIICMKCLDFLKNMENSSTRPKSNKISEAGKRRVFKLMEKKRIPAAAAIDIVLAEQRANELLIESGLKTSDTKGNGNQLPIVPVSLPVSAPLVADPQSRRRLSGAQRKKASILISGGMDPDAARELVYAAALANKVTQHAAVLSQEQFSRDLVDQRRERHRLRQRRRKPMAARNQSANVADQRNKQTNGGVAQTQQPKAIQQKPPVQKVAPVKPVPDAKRPVKKEPLNEKIQNSPGILLPANKRQNQPGARRGPNSAEKRVGPIVSPRRNERPAPYNNNRQQNQSQMQNNNFNQQQSQFHNQNQQQHQPQDVSIEVGIVPINYPKEFLDDMKLDALKEAITNEILKIPQGGPLIRFLGTSSQDGWLKVICADELSYNWLGMLVSRWERAGVRMVEGNSMPQPAILSFYLADDFRPADEILRIIEKQNNELNANQWRVIGRESDRGGQRLTVCVSDQCFRALRNRDFMVFIGLGVVELKPRRTTYEDMSFNNNNSNNQSSQNFRGNNDGYQNYGSNNMQNSRNGMGNNNSNGNYQAMNSGRNNGGGGYNYRNQNRGYQMGAY